MHNFGGMSLLYKISQKVFERGFNVSTDTEAEEWMTVFKFRKKNQIDFMTVMPLFKF